MITELVLANFHYCGCQQFSRILESLFPVDWGSMIIWTISSAKPFTQLSPLVIHGLAYTQQWHECYTHLLSGGILQMRVTVGNFKQDRVLQYNTTVIWQCPPYKVQKCSLKAGQSSSSIHGLSGRGKFLV